MNTKATILLFALFCLVACAPLPPPVTGNLTPNETVDLSVIAEKGDLVSVNYVVTLENGTIVDTNDAALAKQHGVKNYPTGPYSFILGQSGKLKGFDDHIAGMKLGEHRDTIIAPSEPEVVIPVNKTLLRPRFITIPRHQRFPKSAFVNIFGKQPILGDVAYNKTLQFKYKIVNISDEAVLGTILAKNGEEYNLQNTHWPSEVINVREDEILFGQKPTENMTIQSEFGPAIVNVGGSRIAITHHPKVGDIVNKSVNVQEGWSIPQQFQVIEVTDGGFVLKRYGALTDKKLLFSIDLLELTKDVKDVKKSTITVVGPDGDTAN